MNGRVLRECRFQVRQFRWLLGAGERRTTAMGGGDALFKSHVVAGAATPQAFLKLPLLFRRRLECVRVGCARVLWHECSPCLLATLRLNVALNPRATDVASSTGKIGTCPQGGQPMEFWKLLAEREG